ncbi:MAG TPA: hypothetical protein VFG83_11255 [Kofleriaceae bacterium]|nr:hypothetical protein [Kofleriaceae bacterium]
MKEGKESNEFRRYRQALTVVYLLTVVLGASLLGASVVKQLFFRSPPDVALRGPILSAKRPAISHLLRCNRDVRALLTRLGDEASNLLRVPQSGGRPEIASAWETFSRAWLRDYDEVDARCRFSELSGDALGIAYERMAEAHAALPAMRLKYQSLLVQFDEEQAAELSEMRHALERSHAALAAAAEDAAHHVPAPN